jgi:hypothetical protein
MPQVRVDYTRKYTKTELLQLAVARYWDEKKKFQAAAAAKAQSNETAARVSPASAAKIANLY